MTDDRGTLRAIAWRELCPWLIIFRTFALALTLPLLFLATLAVVVQPLGWRMAEVFVSEEMLDNDQAFKVTTERLGNWPSRYSRFWAAYTWRGLTFVEDVTSADPPSVFHRLSDPFRNLFRINLTLYKFCYFLFGGLWTLVIWAFVGGVISRMAVVYLGREERISFKSAAIFVGSRYASFLTAPLYPLLGATLLALPIALLGLVMLLDLGVLVAGLVWFLVLIATLAMAFVLLGLLVGWPLMWPTISAENGDAFEAMSRTYGYTYQRPWHYLFFAIVATIFGGLCWVIVSAFAVTTVHLAWWAASWGTGVERLKEIQAAAASESSDISSLLYGGTGLINFFESLVYCVAHGFGYCLFFCLASAIYLLLRQVDDETELDEVYVEEDDDRYMLPQLKTDAAGVPTPESGENAPTEAE